MSRCWYTLLVPLQSGLTMWYSAIPESQQTAPPSEVNADQPADTAIILGGNRDRAANTDTATAPGSEYWLP
jgi:hypothetical protein